jgi:hypothetical protein
MERKELLPPDAPVHYASVIATAADIDAFTADERGCIIRWVREDGLKPELWRRASTWEVVRLATRGTKLAWLEGKTSMRVWVADVDAPGDAVCLLDRVPAKSIRWSDGGVLFVVMPIMYGVGSIACAPVGVELPPQISEETPDYDGFELPDGWHWSLVEYQPLKMGIRFEDAEVGLDGSFLAWGVDSEKSSDHLPRRLFFPSRGVDRNTKLPLHLLSANEDHLTAISLSEGAIKEIKPKSDRAIRSARFDPIGQFHRFGEVALASSPDRRTVAILGPDRIVFDPQDNPRHIERDRERDWLIAPTGSWLLKYGAGVEAVRLSD